MARSNKTDNAVVSKRHVNNLDDSYGYLEFAVHKMSRPFKPRV